MSSDTEQILSGRRHALLLAAVSEFVATAEPVGSNQIASRHHLGIKSATVRNMMSELEDAGFLSQPHTSAGRVPTDKAFDTTSIIWRVRHASASRSAAKSNCTTRAAAETSRPPCAIRRVCCPYLPGRPRW